MKEKFESADQLTKLISKSTGKKAVKEDIEKYSNYCEKMLTGVNKQNKKENPWFAALTVETLDQYFRRVLSQKLVFDGSNITIQEDGISYNFRAYKQKLLVEFPETEIHFAVVYQGDIFDFLDDNGKVIYSHKYANAFSQEDKSIIGAFCVIRNSKGEFLTILSKERIESRRNLSKIDKYWRLWFPEMCLKTVIKKASNDHFYDVFEIMNAEDNDKSDLDFAGKTQLEKMNIQIVALLDKYEKEDKAAIRQECLEARQNETFDEEFATSIIEKLGGVI